MVVPKCDQMLSNMPNNDYCTTSREVPNISLHTDMYTTITLHTHTPHVIF